MRRSRFTVFTDRGPQVILAYDRAGAAAYYERRGLTVIRVEAGDYRHVEASAKPGEIWKLDREALQLALDFFRIELPVEIKFTGHRGGRLGAHTLDAYGGNVIKRGGRIAHLDSATDIKHKITVKRWLSAEQASRTLWHELAHAMQAERAACAANAITPADILRSWRDCSERGRGISYENKPHEIEAREYEAYHDEIPLVK